MSSSYPSRVPVTLYFDILSPFSYFAFEQLCRLREEWNIDLVLTPVFQSAIISKTGNSPPALVPKKGVYMQKDIGRLSKYFDVPIKTPKALMQLMAGTGSLPIQRLLTAVSMQRPAALEQVIHNFWVRHWSTDQDVIARESHVIALTQDTGLTNEQAEDLLAAAASPEVKAKLNENTEAALKVGAFGVPTLVVTDQMTGKPNQFVFGSDRFHILAMMIGRTWTGPKPDPKRMKSKL
jgi:glutathione S-transferase kappa 1